MIIQPMTWAAVAREGARAEAEVQEGGAPGVDLTNNRTPGHKTNPRARAPIGPRASHTASPVISRGISPEASLANAQKVADQRDANKATTGTGIGATSRAVNHNRDGKTGSHKATAKIAKTSRLAPRGPSNRATTGRPLRWKRTGQGTNPGATPGTSPGTNPGAKTIRAGTAQGETPGILAATKHAQMRGQIRGQVHGQMHVPKTTELPRPRLKLFPIR